MKKNIPENMEKNISEQSNLKSLSQFNAEKLQNSFDLTDLQKPKKNGIACPGCGEELFDSSPMVVLASFPAQKNVHCQKCNYLGYRIA
jgi:hypothetical protein